MLLIFLCSLCFSKCFIQATLPPYNLHCRNFALSIYHRYFARIFVNVIWFSVENKRNIYIYESYLNVYQWSGFHSEQIFIFHNKHCKIILGKVTCLPSVTEFKWKQVSAWLTTPHSDSYTRKTLQTMWTVKLHCSRKLNLSHLYLL